MDAQLALFRSQHRPITAHLGGITWSYLVAGHGPQTLLLLPGAPGIAEMAFAYITAFAPQYRVIAPSYPAEVGSLDLLLAGLDDLIAREISGSFHLIGASYSGMVAQYLVPRHAERIASLQIGDTGVPRPERARAMELATNLVARSSQTVFSAFLSTVLRFVLKGQSPAHRFWQRYFKGVVANLRVDEFANRVRVMIDMDRQGQRLHSSPGWQGPTLLLETAADPLFSPTERASLRQRFPHAETHTFHSRGHITALTRAPEYIAVMSAFLQRLN
ncbi:alpha/beta hydrolase fold protein [Oscillochloris trichoides DG-6]|uniref:Alpha/beta hydrolase fold protein n=1 Tax=Oscillochloris trichoides DG-6 TaxID=765420 RepID=E1IHQ4_9CHLR|nr:alpha/beta hydrolase fold protein [Oscillochloris trichoides DG-6]